MIEVVFSRSAGVIDRIFIHDDEDPEKHVRGALIIQRIHRPTTAEQLAQRMYAERVAERGPAWHQLGEVTKGVWREIALKEIFG